MIKTRFWWLVFGEEDKIGEVYEAVLIEVEAITEIRFQAICLEPMRREFRQLFELICSYSYGISAVKCLAGSKGASDS